MLNVLSRSLPVKLLDAVANGAQTSTVYAMPARASALQWQTLFGTAPASVNIVLEMSLDGTNWDVMDTSTSVNGEMRTFSSIGSKQVRVRVTAVVGGSTTTVIVQCD
jgi:hypothetical protein